MMLSDDELERYSRQLILPDFDIEQQERLAGSRVLVVGCGGLGHPLATYLAIAGVGSLTLADGDNVEISNLHRQPLFQVQDVGKPKVVRAVTELAKLAPACVLRPVVAHLTADLMSELVAAVDLVADCSDNYPTRFALNRTCIQAKKPLVSAAASRLEGQLTTFDVESGTACYRCLYPQEGAASALSCRENGVLGPVTGVLGSLQALEILKILAGLRNTLRGKLILLDLDTHQQQLLDIARRPDCPDCRR